jgi:hypothetical protein
MIPVQTYATAADMRAYRPRLVADVEERANLAAANASYRFRPQLPLRVSRIIREACTAHGVRIADLMDGKRTRHICLCRNEVVYRIRDHATPPSFPTIGRWVGRDHTSCLWAASRHAADSGLPSVTLYDADKVRANNARRRALDHAKAKRERTT